MFPNGKCGEPYDDFTNFPSNNQFFFVCFFKFLPYTAHKTRFPIALNTKNAAAVLFHTTAAEENLTKIT